MRSAWSDATAVAGKRLPRRQSYLFLPSERNAGDQISLNSRYFFPLVSNVYTLGSRKWEESEYAKDAIKPM